MTDANYFSIGEIWKLWRHRETVINGIYKPTGGPGP